MHKKLEADLMSLAHSILKMKNKDDVFALKEISKEVYEKLSMLAFVEEYVNSTPNLETSKEELLEQVKTAFDKKEISKQPVLEVEKDVKPFKQENESVEVEEQEKIVYDLMDDAVEESAESKKFKEKVVDFNREDLESKKEEVVEEIIEQPFDELEQLMFATENPTNFKNDVKDVGEKKTPTLEDELQDTISVDVMADLFENVQPKSLNDKLFSNIQIGLNDRITFVKNLFEGDQENYNRVISQLNTFKTEKEARKFINKMVKPDYNWSEHEELENRFMEIVSRKFA
ncbi:hypothetical protein [Polaribacter sp.]|jgi:hypothetical protein|uniref:hypothetical protein n=1 Tax=Polaribacter sp. TaxID=1920175 RepID=UPI003F69FB79